jgi:enterochelin esterase-like enzyme
MSVRTAREPSVTEDAVEFTVADPSLSGVALLHELRRPRRVPFARSGRVWRLRFPRPLANRLEYLLEWTSEDGSAEVGLDPTNPLRAPGPFGEKSVIEFPGYSAPAWASDEDAVRGNVRPFPLPTVRLHTVLPALLWSAADTDPERPLPLLLVHDGPEYAEYSQLLRLLDHLVDFGEIPECRAVLLPPPLDRDETYSASARYANAFGADLVPSIRERVPVDGAPVLLGASLGALAAVHIHARTPGLLGGMFLQSGSFFRRRFDSHEERFDRFARITRFVGLIHGGRGLLPEIPTTITCGTAEENLDNNRAFERALNRRGWKPRTFWNRDAHNWTAWRDALHPHLAELLLRAWR